MAYKMKSPSTTRRFFMKSKLKTVLFVSTTEQSVIPQNKVMDVFNGVLAYPEFSGKKGYLINLDKDSGKLLFITPIIFDNQGAIDQSDVNQQILDKINTDYASIKSESPSNDLNTIADLAVKQQIEAYKKWKESPNREATGRLIVKSLIVGEVLIPLLESVKKI